MNQHLSRVLNKRAFCALCGRRVLIVARGILYLLSRTAERAFVFALHTSPGRVAAQIPVSTSTYIRGTCAYRAPGFFHATDVPSEEYFSGRKTPSFEQAARPLATIDNRVEARTKPQTRTYSRKQLVGRKKERKKGRKAIGLSARSVWTDAKEFPEAGGLGDCSYHRRERSAERVEPAGPARLTTHDIKQY